MIISKKRLVILVIIVAYVLIWKIPLPCYGCESESIWYRCLNGTGEGTNSCEAHKKVQTIIDEGGDIASTIAGQGSVFLENIWEFTTDDLPDIISDFIAQIKDTLSNLKTAIAAKIESIIEFLKEKAGVIADKIKDLASSTYTNYIKVVIDPIISFVTNNIVQPMVYAIEKIIEFRNLVWSTLKDAVSSITNLGIGDFVGDVVDIVQGIPDVMADLLDLIVSLVNDVKTKIYTGINWGLETSTNLVNTSVNAASDVLESGLDTSVGVINTVVNGVEVGVGAIVSGVNTSMNVVESITNSLGDKVETAVNKVVGAVNTVDDAFETFGSINFGAGVFDWYPFDFVKDVVPRLSEVDIPELNISDLSAPTWDDIDPPDIPTIDITPPEVEEPADFEAPDELLIPGFGWVGDKISGLKTSIKELFETAMAPLYTAVRTIVTLISSVASSIAYFFKTYVNYSGLKTGIGIILGVVKDQLINIKNFVVSDVIPAIISVLQTIKDPVLDFVGLVAERTWTFMKLVGQNVGDLMKSAYNLATKVLGSVTKNVLYMITYTTGALSDKALFFVPGPVTFKLSLVLTLLVYILLGSYAKNLVDILKFLFIPVKTMAMTIYETDKSLDMLVGISR